MEDDKKRKSLKQRMEENKNPTFDFKKKFGNKGKENLYQTDTTGLASGKKNFVYSRTLVDSENKKLERIYSPVSAKHVKQAIAKYARPDTPLAETPEPKKID